MTQREESGYRRDLEYSENTVLMSPLEEVSRILDAYSKAILTPDS